MRFITGLLLLAISFGAVATLQPSTASAAEIFTEVCKGSASSSPVCQDAKNPTSPVDIIGKVVQIISIIVGIAAVIVIIISGLRMVTSAGDSKSFGSARSALLFSLVGLILAVLAGVIVNIILSNIS